ncbi:helix-turn-helix transcriptional regulator [Streptomyces lutosisoli]|uniref:Helix-turn-helix transcriptional regulator n=1 Tax=Streptomyces lutosisoli TaxID=2665721 RepID=A0ABW2VF66_9ACTN
MNTAHEEHSVEDLCETGSALYGKALREGRLRREAAESAPCLTGVGLLQPDAADARWLRPVAPSVALPRLLRAIEEDIAHQRRREAKLADAFEPFMTLDAQIAPGTDPLAIALLTGFEQINTRITHLLAESSREVLAIQPGRRPPSDMGSSVPKEQSLLDRGGRMRTLYQHTQRHSPAVLAHYEQLHGDVEVRTLDELSKRLFVLDRTVALIPASADRTMALEIRHPALVEYLVTAFEQLWQLAIPMHPEAAQRPSLNGITPRQHAIAALLIEGHTDAVIAERLGMNVRTARVHIAKLAATLGSESRAQLGYLIGQSGILDQRQDGDEDPEQPPAHPSEA